MGEGYQVDPRDLDEAAAGVHAVLDALAALGVGKGVAGQGRGVSVIPAQAGPIGHDGLARALVAFCERWEWGVRAAVQTGRDMADDLTATARAYTEGDRHPAGLLGRIHADLTGDPRADPAAAEGRTWDELAAPHPEGLTDAAAALDEAGATWARTARDVAANSGPGMVWAALTGQDPLAGQREDVEALLHGPDS
jgi:hypothetical protein